MSEQHRLLELVHRRLRLEPRTGRDSSLDLGGTVVHKISPEEDISAYATVRPSPPTQRRRCTLLVMRSNKSQDSGGKTGHHAIFDVLETTSSCPIHDDST